MDPMGYDILITPDNIKWNSRKNDTGTSDRVKVKGIEDWD